MKTAVEYLAEVERLREMARSTTDQSTSAAIQVLILELERRARELGNGSARAT